MRVNGHSLSRIAEATGATISGSGDAALIEHLSIDSRKPFIPESTLFIALRGERHDGHHYIAQLAERGMRHFLVDGQAELPPMEGVTILHVSDTLLALQRIAAWHRGQFDIPVIGITGSNGKTVVKEWLFQLLREREQVVRSPGSWNSQVGVPLSVWEMGPEHTLGLFEAGISMPGEMDRLQAMIAPTIGVFSNIGPAHGENFSDQASKASEKAHLFRGVEVMVYCADHALVHEALSKTLPANAKVRAWSRKGPAWSRVVKEEVIDSATHLVVECEGHSIAFDVPFTDPGSVENALHCAAVLLHLGYPAEWIAERMPELQPVAMRLETLDGEHGTTLINDAYSNDEASLAIALDHLTMVAQGRGRTIVLSDIHQSGEPPEQLYQRVAEKLARAGVGSVIGIGPCITAHATLFAPTSRFFSDARQAATAIDPSTFAGDVILVKGARAFALETLVQRWQRQSHGTVLEVDLEAVRHNLNHFRALLASGGKVRTMAMIKAFGYGSGALELARLFAHEQVHYLGVAYVDEGIELRRNGIRTPILVMNPEPVPFEILYRHRLEAEVFDQRSLEEAARMVDRDPDSPPIHLKLDTGMHRLGFTVDDMPDLIEALRRAPGLKIGSILSHLVASEDPRHDAFTRSQITTFLEMASAIGRAVDQRPLLHIANTAAISRFPEARLDMVRLGIGLHGIGGSAEETALLRPVATLSTPIAQIKHIPAGDGVSYGRRWVASRDSRIATLPIGYADGLSRRLGNGVGSMWINGHRAPIVGAVCMDMCMVDVTDISCTVHDTAVVFGREHPVQEMADALGTIPYEVLTGIAQRVKRVYVHG